MVRVRFAAVAALIFLVLAVAADPQGASDLVGVLKDLRKALNEFNTRLEHVEQLVKELAKKENKGASGRERAATRTPAATPAAPALELAQDAYQRGRVAEDRGNYDPAIEAYSKAIQFDPRNDSAFLHRAYSYFQAGRIDLSLSDVNQSLSIQPENSRAYEFRSRVYRALRDYPHAITDLEQALKRDPNPDFLIAQASIEEERGDYKKAIDIYGNALARQPASPDIHLKRASAYKALNDTNGALSDCAAALAAKPAMAEAYLCRADSYVRMGLLPAAAADLNEALRLKPNSAEASSMITTVRNLVTLNEELKKANASLSAIEKPNAATIASTPPPAETAPAPTTSAATVLSLPIPIPETLPVIQVQVASAKPAVGPRAAKEAQYLTFVGRANALQGKFDDAIENLTSAIELDPSSALAYNSRGYAYLRSRKYKLALSDFTTAIRLNSTYANAHWNLGVTLRLIGDQKAGMQHMQMAAALQKEAYSGLLARKLKDR